MFRKEVIIENRLIEDKHRYGLCTVKVTKFKFSWFTLWKTETLLSYND